MLVVVGSCVGEDGFLLHSIDQSYKTLFVVNDA
jgi:hypothetical protein